MATDIQLESIKKKPYPAIALRPAAEQYLHLLKDSTSTMARKTEDDGLNLLPHNETYHSCRFISFAAPEQLGQLTAAHDPATSSRGNQDPRLILSQSLNMDTTDFAIRFDPTVSSLIKTSGRTFSNLKAGRRCR
ncbi:hypothetical protein BDM02DRAFT_389150 [Thelephora ganbajun]|uniref:Uncharacterized protein n=1 Tax=Thelephora ganbajun TaxID=370292 RepID=A0ACB6Z9U0_THEGA|nr:hypothetical protein BDM02DRAFT_389150 [Thelephora ganbajun]